MGPVLDISRRFAVLTVTSARPFDCGKPTDTPEAQELLCVACYEIRAAVTGYLLREAKRSKERAQVANQACGASKLSAS